MTIAKIYDKIQRLSPPDTKIMFEDLRLCLNALSPCSLNNFEIMEKLDHLRKRGCDVYGYFEDSKLLGIATLLCEPKLIRNGGKVGHIEDVAVKPDKQGSGIGRALVEFLIAHAKECGCYKVILDCSPDVADFYNKLGFKAKGYYMRKDLI
jgi:glucosamine-phosphate N-acetyltransferase